MELLWRGVALQHASEHVDLCDWNGGLARICAPSHASASIRDYGVVIFGGKDEVDCVQMTSGSLTRRLAHGSRSCRPLVSGFLRRGGATASLPSRDPDGNFNIYVFGGRNFNGILGGHVGLEPERACLAVCSSERRPRRRGHVRAGHPALVQPSLSLSAAPTTALPSSIGYV